MTALVLSGLQGKLIELLRLDPESAAQVERAIVVEWESRRRDGDRFVWKIAESPRSGSLSHRAATVHLGMIYTSTRPSQGFIAPTRIDDFDGKTVWEWTQ